MGENIKNISVSRPKKRPPSDTKAANALMFHPVAIIG
jgi:hypothetical protein